MRIQFPVNQMGIVDEANLTMASTVGVERGALIEQPFTCLMRSVLSFPAASKIKRYQAAYDYESAYYQQTGHLLLTPLRRKMPRIMDIAEISNPTPISV